VTDGATVSTHVLDVGAGKPAAGLRVRFGSRTVRTDDNGRIADLSGGSVALGTHTLVFETGRYYGNGAHLFETVTLEIRIDEPRHYHVPLLISPFSCSSYRGT
jgi:5-hydroxyisourate hydrolase